VDVHVETATAGQLAGHLDPVPAGV
jgi:hypothetical protein